MSATVTAAAATAYLLAGLAAAAYVAIRVTGWAGPGTRTALDRAACALFLGVMEIVLVTQALGAVHLLYALPVLGVLLLGAALAWRLVPVESSPSFSPPGGWSSESWALAIGGAALGGFASALALWQRSLDFDTVAYHLPHAATWLIRGETWSLPVSYEVGDQAYPGNGELLGTWTMLGSHTDHLAPLVPVILGMLVLLAVAAIARAVGGRADRAALLGLVFLGAPVSTFWEFSSLQTDFMVAAGLLMAVVFLLWSRETDQARWWSLAGLALGMAAGAKYTGVLPALATAVVFGLVRRPTARNLALMVACAAAAGGTWYVRNAVMLGNPIYPQALRALGLTLLRGSDEPYYLQAASMGYWLAHGSAEAVGGWAQSVLYQCGPALVVVLLGGLWAAADRGARARGVERALGVLALLWTVIYLVTPLTGGTTAFVNVLAIYVDVRFVTAAALLLCTLAALMLPGRLIGALAVGGALFDVYSIVVGPGFRPEIAGRAHLVVPAVAAAALAVAAGWASQRGAPHRGRAILAGSAAIGVAAIFATYVLRPAHDDVITRALAATHGGRVAVVDVVDLRAVLGDRLDRDLRVVFGRRDPGTPDPGRAREFEAAVEATGSRVLVVDLRPGHRASQPPAGWTPGPGWRHFGVLLGSDVFVWGP